MLTRSQSFRSDHPHLFFLDEDDLVPLTGFLRKAGVLKAEDRVESAARAGDGNMNCTVRARTGSGSFILKQARPWVEKYPQFAAPWDRACREAEFYQLAATRPELAAMMPRVRHFDVGSRVLVLEDLGEAADCTGVYRGERFTVGEVASLAAFLSALHREFMGDENAARLLNREMRELNHAHIFTIPLAANNGLDLDSITPGLADAAWSLQGDARYCRAVEQLGREVYLADGPCLLHGDFFPGSVLRTDAGLKVIDPEFGFFGRPEFDVAVFFAHLPLARQPVELQSAWRRAYAPSPGFDDAVMQQLAGVEIMRRLIGYAQLPLICGIETKRELLELSRGFVLTPGSHPLHSTST